MKPRSRRDLERLWHEQLKACVKCGTCLAFCPVYQRERREQASMRGKLALLQGWNEGLPVPAPAIVEALNSCTGCQNCRAHCPNGVDTTLAVWLGRLLLPRSAWEIAGLRLWAWALQFPTGRSLWRWWRRRRPGEEGWLADLRGFLPQCRVRRRIGPGVVKDAQPCGTVVVGGCEGSCSAGAVTGRWPWNAAGTGQRIISLVGEPCCGALALEIPDLESFAQQASTWFRSLIALAPERVVIADLRCLAAVSRMKDLCDLEAEETTVWQRITDPFTWVIEQGDRPPARSAGPVLLADPTAHWPGSSVGTSARRLLLQAGATAVVDSGVAGGGCDCRGGRTERGLAAGPDPREVIEQRARGLGADRVLTVCPTCPERARRMGRRLPWEYALTWLGRGDMDS